MRGPCTADVTWVTFTAASTPLIFHRQLVMDSKINMQILTRHFSLFATGKQNVRLHPYEKQNFRDVILTNNSFEL